MHRWIQLADDVALLQFPWRVAGIDFRRNVSLLRLRDGRLIIHSTAPFDPEDLATIRDFGEPAWLVEATWMHDTFAREGRAPFPDLPYLAPKGFSETSGIATTSLLSPPDEWIGEVETMEIAGLRWNHEHVFFHRGARVLVLADALTHFPPETRGWPRFFVHHLMRLPRLVGTSIFFRMIIRDRTAFARSMRKLLEWDFEQIVVGHGEPIQKGAKTIFAQALRDRGLTIDS